MMIPDRKKTVSTILSRMDKGGNDLPDAVEGPDEGLKSAAEDMLMAIKDNNPDDLVSAMKAFVSMADKDEPMGEE